MFAVGGLGFLRCRDGLAATSSGARAETRRGEPETVTKKKAELFSRQRKQGAGRATVTEFWKNDVQVLDKS